MPTALIVEDEPEANLLLAMLVQLRGYRTVSAFTGGEALEKVRHQAPDIVFLDLMLPDINGYEVCRSLKTKRDTSLIPVVMVTARIAAENRIQSFRVGADDYIPKPYTPDQIYQAMDDADAWRRDVEGPSADGEILLKSHDDGESLRQIAQLRSLLFAKTPLDLETVGRIGSVLAEISSEAGSWGRDNDIQLVATIDYRLETDRIILTLRESADWLKDSLLLREGRRSRWHSETPFDEIVEQASDGRVAFLKRFPVAESATPE
ncbi:response regulator [Singulisphaera rosea]